MTTLVYWNVHLAVPEDDTVCVSLDEEPSLSDPITFETVEVSLVCELLDAREETAVIRVFGEPKEVRKSNVWKHPLFDEVVGGDYYDSQEELVEALTQA